MRFLHVGLAVVLGLSLVGVTAQGAAPKTFYVAVDGNDSWSGQLSAANSAKADGPFATVSRALKATEDYRRTARADAREPVQIIIRGGNYFLAEPLILRPEHSNLTLTAFEKETPILSGGRALTGWKPASINGKHLWTVTVPEAKEGKWRFHELWTTGHRATRARLPNRGYLAIAEVPDKAASWTDGQQRFKFKAGELEAWPGAANAEVVAMTRWVESRLPIKTVDPAERLVTFRKRAVFELSPGDLYYVEGALELLDVPGEWCLDSVSGQVWYMPRPGETIDVFVAVAPVLTQVLRLEGKPEAEQFVQNVVFRGLTLKGVLLRSAPC